MITTAEIVLSGGAAKVVVPDGIEITFEAAREAAVVPGAHPNLMDLVVRMCGGKQTLTRFATPHSPEPFQMGTPLVPRFWYAVFTDGHPAMLLVGDLTVEFVEMSHCVVREILRLFREEHRDLGFDHMELVPSREGLVVAYEKGAALIRSDGSVVWHNELS